jgi:hypothetical protein
MNFAFLAAGTSSTNPQMLILGLAVVLVGAGAGVYGLDRWLMPRLARVLSGRADVKRVMSGIAPLLLATALMLATTDGATFAIAFVIALTVVAFSVMRPSSHKVTATE